MDRDSSVFTILSSKPAIIVNNYQIEIVLFLQYSQAAVCQRSQSLRIEIVLFLQYSQARTRREVTMPPIEIVLFLQYSQARRETAFN